MYTFLGVYPVEHTGALETTGVSGSNRCLPTLRPLGMKQQPGGLGLGETLFDD